jgi:ethanolamine utilization microcompartment shell protein EutL
MHTSRPIEVQGRFLGVAVTQAAATLAAPTLAIQWRFIATDPAVEDLDGATFSSPAEAQRVAGLVLQRSRQPAGAVRRPVIVR